MHPDTLIILNVLFVHSSRHHTAPWRDGSTRYRCYHLAEALRKKGILADVTSFSELRLEHVSRYHTICILRPQSGRILDQVLKHCRQSGVHTVADVDDLVFDPAYAALSPAVVNQQAAVFSVRRRFASNLHALLSFDELTVATEPLAQHWCAISKKTNVTVVPNGLSERWLATPVNQPINSGTDARTITYLPGSSSHDRDFSEISDILADVLHLHKNLKLQIIGTLKIDLSLFPSRRVSRTRWVNYCRLPQLIADSDVTLAPLVKTPFTQAKSHIKFIESAAFGTPVICSPTHDICRHTSPGLAIANDSADWYAALNKTIHYPLSQQVLNAMRTHVRQTSTAEQSAEIFLTKLTESGLPTLKNAA